MEENSRVCPNQKLIPVLEWEIRGIRTAMFGVNKPRLISIVIKRSQLFIRVFFNKYFIEGRVLTNIFCFLP